MTNDFINTKRFELHEVKRIPVNYSEETIKFISTTSHEGTKLAQTFSEYFAHLSVRIELQVEPRHLYHIAESEQEKLLRVTIYRTDKENTGTPFSVFIPDYILGQEMRTVGKNAMGFLAHNAVTEILRMYMLYLQIGEE